MPAPLNLTVRIASPEDAVALAILGRRTFADAFAADNNPEDMEAYLKEAFSPKQLHSELTTPHTLFLMAEMNDKPIGYAKVDDLAPPSCVTFPNPGHISRIYVDQQWLGHRVGKTLMQHCVVSAKAEGYESLWLGVWEHNTRAVSFYKKWHFATVGTTTFVLGEDVQTDLVMARMLG